MGTFLKSVDKSRPGGPVASSENLTEGGHVLPLGI